MVIGTVGGGTYLPKQKEALELLGCYGNGKIERFARAISGFALALEISTYAAIVSGEFAKAHEKLGRNKPVKWLLKSDINANFIKECLVDPTLKIESVSLSKRGLIENGILTDITKRACKKLIGFIPFNITYTKNNNKYEKQGLIKSKALDIEVIKGLHLMAASIDPQLSDLIYEHKEILEYKNCHKKEILIFEELHKQGFESIPYYYGKKIQNSRPCLFPVTFSCRLCDYRKCQHPGSQDKKS